jgi:hypothetical protein
MIGVPSPRRATCLWPAGVPPASIDLVMTRMSPFRRARPAAVVLMASWVLHPVAAAGEEPALRASSDYCAEIDGSPAPDARFFTAEGKGGILVDLPSLSTSAFIKLKARKVVTLSPESIKHPAGDDTARLVDPVPPDAPFSEISVDGQVWRFRIKDSEVRILKGSDCRPAEAPVESPVVTPVVSEGPMADDINARKCLHQEERPSAAAAGCVKSAYLRNSCDTPVRAVIQTTQHLFTGTLPQTSSILVTPGADYPLGCTWFSGAMAPTSREVLAAEFVGKRGSGPGGRGPTGH